MGRKWLAPGNIRVKCVLIAAKKKKKKSWLYSKMSSLGSIYSILGSQANEFVIKFNGN